MPRIKKGWAKNLQKARQKVGKNSLQTGENSVYGDPQGSAGGAGPSSVLIQPNGKRPAVQSAASPDKPSSSLEKRRQHLDEGDHEGSANVSVPSRGSSPTGERPAVSPEASPEKQLSSLENRKEHPDKTKIQHKIQPVQGPAQGGAVAPGVVPQR
eukprot:CAMPEP_0173432340 /NCGR_PEP_ID=MMETSP1357-20121228/10175_1 /TAXON_ID=77926 /ORGANISM="Hemiselmis rufescens, Strain PCC563" /LENGTH=154 /DNA_ID=CAMNT_0014396925 /DNA_START=148 /DNA_END=613 /DNA_ORIENTATION=-